MPLWQGQLAGGLRGNAFELVHVIVGQNHLGVECKDGPHMLLKYVVLNAGILYDMRYLTNFPSSVFGSTIYRRVPSEGT
jgi:hypothetical protein